MSDFVQLKIGMVDVDLLNNGTRHPNLAQMKMSGFCKSLGHNVRLIYKPEELGSLDTFDIIIASRVFNFNKDPKQIIKLKKRVNPNNIIGFSEMSDEDKLNRYHNRCVYTAIQHATKKKPTETLLLLGGTGYFEDGGIDLKDIIEHHYPDYDLYTEYVQTMIASGRPASYFNDYTECFIGFTTRGCFRKCGFCVNKKFDRCKRHTPIPNFVDLKKNPERKRIMLWDDNLFAYAHWEDVVNDLMNTGLPFQFRQGLDLRLMTEKRAKVFSEVKSYGDYIFAFDHIQDKELIETRLSRWLKYNKKETKLYVLTGYDARNPQDAKYGNRKNIPVEKKDLEDIEFTFERIAILMRYGCLPYIMKYISYKESPYSGIYVQLGRWCNQPKIFKKMTFEEFCIRNQKYATNPDRDCAALRALKLLKQDAPDIYDKYARLKFTEEREKYASEIPNQIKM